MEFKQYLKFLKSIDYPNQTENLLSASKYIDYTPHEFQKDLLSNLGVVGTTDFIQQTFSKLGLMSSPGFKVMLNYGNGDYVYLIINSFDIVEFGENSFRNPYRLPFLVEVDYSWGDSRIVWGEDNERITIEDAYDEVGLGEMGEWDELIDLIQDDVKLEVYKQTGFMIYFDSEQ
jgi:hypothetical protein